MADWIWRHECDCPGGYPVTCQLSNGSHVFEQTKLDALARYIGPSPAPEPPYKPIKPCPYMPESLAKCVADAKATCEGEISTSFMRPANSACGAIMKTSSIRAATGNTSTARSSSMSAGPSRGSTAPLSSASTLRARSHTKGKSTSHRKSTFPMMMIAHYSMGNISFINCECASTVEHTPPPAPRRTKIAL